MTLDEAIGTLEELKHIGKHTPDITEALIRAQQALSIFAVLERLPRGCLLELDRSAEDGWHLAYSSPEGSDLTPQEHSGETIVDTLGQFTFALALEGG